MKRVIAGVLSLCVLMVSVFLMVDVVKYPEKYLTTWRYQLYNDIQSGDKEAIAYYETRYIASGNELFEQLP